MTEDPIGQIHALGDDFVRTRSGLEIPKPDQGYRVVYLRLDVPGATGLVVWEGQEGDDLEGFLARWELWLESDERFLHFTEPRYGFDHVFPRDLVPRVIEIGYCFVPRQDTRAEAMQDTERPRAVELEVPVGVARQMLRSGRARRVLN